jgi:hypothetical protein
LVATPVGLGFTAYQLKLNRAQAARTADQLKLNREQAITRFEDDLAREYRAIVGRMRLEVCVA